MKILVTGATGFVGKNLLPKLIKEGHEIFEITIEPELSKQLYNNSTYQFYFQYENLEELRKAVESFKPEVVIHLASYLTASDETSDMRKLLDANIYFLCIILDVLKQSGAKWFINTGSFAEYYKGDGQLDPAYLYTATKSASRVFVDYYSKAYDFNYITVAPYTIYGGKDTQKKIIDIIYDSLNSETPLDLTPGNQVLDFIHLDDVTDFYLLLVHNLEKINNKTNFQLGTGIGHTLQDLVKIIEIQTGKKANINWGGKQYRLRDVMYAVANISLQHHLFGWKPAIPLERGVKMFLKVKENL
ncbi:MAG: NAD(P)-dependent oxidoreductase [Bacteroidales bacterium]|nr:NAD(P)-dependent oxidoreductase [Bacteroidales bacterium]